MRLGLHAATWMSSWNDDVVPILGRAADLGFDSVELSLLGGDDAAYRRVARAGRELGLDLTCTTGLSPASDVGSADPAVRSAGHAALASAVRAATALGARRLSGVIYGAWGHVEPERRTERWDRAVEALQQVAPAANDGGVVLGIEAINRYETDLVNTAAQASAMADAVDRPNVGVLLDAYHMNIEEKDPVAAIVSCGSRLVHMHVAGNDRGVPADGTLDWLALFGALRTIGYDERVTLEMFVRSDVDVSRDLTVWRPIEPDPHDAARRALGFLQERIR